MFHNEEYQDSHSCFETRSIRIRNLQIKSVAFFAFACCLALSAQAQDSEEAPEVEIVELRTNDIIYDPIRDRIYASVPSSADANRANTITTINPNTGAIEASVFVGSDPGPLAISDNGQYVYVGLEGAAAVRRYDVATQTAGLQFSLGTGNHGPSYAEDIEVLPGNPNVVAISLYRRGVSPRHDGIAVYNNGTRRANSTRDHTGGNRIVFSESSSVLYGYNNTSTESGLREIAITDSGAEEISVVRDVIRGGDIEFADGIIYASTGAAVDGFSKLLLGTYRASGSVAVDVDQNRVYFLQGGSLKTFNRTTFIEIESQSFSNISGSGNDLILTGTDRFAFRPSNSQVALVGSSAAGAALAGLRVPNIHDSSQSETQSFLRFHNTGIVEGTVQVTLAGADDGVDQATWTSPPIAPNASLQFDIARIELEAADGIVDPRGFFTTAITSEFNGYFQHVLWRSSEGTITNATVCNTGLTSDPTRLMNVHSSRLSSYPTSISIHNTGAADAKLELRIHDAASGVPLGTFFSETIPSNGQITQSISDIEARAGIIPSSNQFQYNLQVTNSFEGTLQHIVTSTDAGTLSDMTAHCALVTQ